MLQQRVHSRVSASRQARPAAQARPVRGRKQVQCNAFWQQLLSKVQGGAASQPASNSSGEKFLYKPSEMKKIGDLDVSPMGLGTWSWVR